MSKKILKILLPIVFLTAGLLASVAIISSEPQALRGTPSIAVPVVETVSIRATAHRVEIGTSGVVVAAKKVSISSQVSGEIIAQNNKLVPGGIISKGEELVRIDPRDYEFAVIQKQEAVDSAEYKLKYELGQQDIATEEWALLGQSIEASAEDKELILRKPQLKIAQSALESARSSYDKAKLDLERTVIKSPFNAVVRSENVERGQVITTNTELASCVSTDYLWVRVSLPYDDLKMISIPGINAQKGSVAEISLAGSSGSASYDGRVDLLQSDLQEEGRMAQLLIRVDDPLNLRKGTGGQKLPLLLGSFVQVNIFSQILENVYPIPVTALRDNDDIAAGSEARKALIWILSPDNKLEEREVTLLWLDKNCAYASEGLSENDRVIVSSLLAPLVGMDLRDLNDRAVQPEFKPEDKQLDKEGR